MRGAAKRTELRFSREACRAHISGEDRKVRDERREAAVNHRRRIESLAFLQRELLDFGGKAGYDAAHERLTYETHHPLAELGGGEKR